MASFKLGAIITDIAGSVGGTTLRRTQRGLIMYNKQSRQIKSAYNQNNRRLELGAIFSDWRLLDNQTKKDWTYWASLWTFKDKFGNNVQLTGRELYTKCHSAFIGSEGYVDVGYFNDPIPTNVVQYFDIGVQDGLFDVYYNDTGQKIYIQAEFYLLRAGQNSKPTRKFFKTFTIDATNSNSKNMFNAFKLQFPNYVIGDYYGINIYFVSLFGLKSAVQSFVVQIQ